MKKPRLMALGALVVLAAGTYRSVGANGGGVSAQPTGAYLRSLLVRAQDDAGVKLEYKWKPGQVFRYRVNGGGTITMKMEGLPIPAGAPGAPPAGGFPMEMQINVDLVQRVKSVAPDGSAMLTQKLQAMDMINKVMGQQVVAKFDGSKFVMTLNGQAMPAPAQIGDAGAQMGKEIELKLTRRGQVLALEQGARQALSRVFGGTQLSAAFGSGTMGAGMLVLPEMPVKAGQSWTDKQSNTVPVQGGFPGAQGATDLQVDYAVQNTLLRLEGEGPNRVAVIGMKAEATMPEAKASGQNGAKKPETALPVSIRAFNQKVNGTINFDPEAGLVRNGDYTVDLGMKMDLPFGAPPGGANGATPQMAMDGSLKMKVALLPDGKSAAPARQ